MITELNPEEIRTETFRSSPTRLDTNETCVRVIHIPTGSIAESCNERSFTKNKLAALAALKEKLNERLSNCSTSNN